MPFPYVFSGKPTLPWLLLLPPAMRGVRSRSIQLEIAVVTFIVIAMILLVIVVSLIITSSL